MKSQERARLQTTDEWLREFATGKVIEPTQAIQESSYKSWMHERPAIQTDNAKFKKPIFVYDTHRTTKNGTLVLVLMVQETGEEAVAFFNVDIRRQRGKEKGQSYRSGHKGQFWPAPRSKFRKFWMAVVGKEPVRWAFAYKFLQPRLKGQQFTGTLTRETSNNQTYLKISGLTKVGTRNEQFRNNLVTSQEQFGNEN